MARLSSVLVVLCFAVVRGAQLSHREAGDSLHAADPKKAAAKPKDGAAAPKKVEDLNKDMPMKAQEQGFTGKKVEHKDGKTAVSDWHSEYGNSKSFAQADPKKAAAKPEEGKKAGKVEDLNKDMPMKAQEQGFTGKKVEHKDGKTAVSDWHSEYGNSKSFAQADPKKAAAKPKEGKKAAKVEDLNKDMPMKAQEQGFTGKKVEHKDGKTAVSDWHDEYGNAKFLQGTRADPKKAAPESKKADSNKVDLGKKMPLKAQEQGYSGKKVQHVDGETKTDDWRNEYGNEKATPKKAQKSGSIHSNALPAAVLLAITACLFA